MDNIQKVLLAGAVAIAITAALAVADAQTNGTGPPPLPQDMGSISQAPIVKIDPEQIVKVESHTVIGADAIVFTINEGTIHCAPQTAPGRDTVWIEARDLEEIGHYHGIHEWFGGHDVEAHYGVFSLHGRTNTGYTIYDISLENDTRHFSGVGIVYEMPRRGGDICTWHDPVVPTEDPLFVVDIRGDCAGTSFNMTSRSATGFNFTADDANYHAICGL